MDLEELVPEAERIAETLAQEVDEYLIEVSRNRRGDILVYTFAAGQLLRRALAKAGKQERLFVVKYMTKTLKSGTGR